MRLLLALLALLTPGCSGAEPPPVRPRGEPAARLECPPGRGDCDGDPANGCEVDLSSDADACHVCGRSCRLPHTEAACFDGQCRILSCAPGWGDCDHRVENGCETALCYTSHGWECRSPCPLVTF